VRIPRISAVIVFLMISTIEQQERKGNLRVRNPDPRKGPREAEPMQEGQS
jgi:hypothetical protein